ncbi:hypothetical protein SK128_018323 [Halocaridina rubra]|uniref:Uncharacterized protein n=1 Tax=Halocaridina rubra TaxID=373956 RepID=A0AAN8WKL0_HALRR
MKGRSRNYHIVVVEGDSKEGWKEVEEYMEGGWAWDGGWKELLRRKRLGDDGVGKEMKCMGGEKEAGK